jgi:hypothetical protein
MLTSIFALIRTLWFFIVDNYLLCHGAKLVDYDYNTSTFVFALSLDVNVKLWLKVDDDGGVDDGSCIET